MRQIPSAHIRSYGMLSCADFSFLSALFAAVGCVFGAETVAKLLGSENEYLYGRITATKIVSTIQVPSFAAKEDDQTVKPS